jgi:outer membrane lipoprotein SlyB
MPGKRKARSLRARSGAAVSKNEMKRFKRGVASIGGGSLGTLYGTKVGKMTGSAVTESEMKRLKKAIKRRK